MTYHLILGDRSYSSWSLRGWLLLRKFDLPFTQQITRLYEPGFAQDLEAWAPARTVPAMRLSDGALLWDSLAMAETLAEAHPDLGFWPKDPAARAAARSIAAEMHSGFGALRGACPMNLRLRYTDFEPSDAVRTDLARIETLWAHARAMAGDGPWLFGDYSAADAFYAPVAARIHGYGVPVGQAAQDYVATSLADPAFKEWRAAGMTEADQREYDMPNHSEPWRD